MKEPMLCPRCGVQLPGGTPPEECPRCLMNLALSPGEGSDPGEVVVTRYGDAAPPPDPAALAPHFPNLEILEVLGQGGMGVVYKARQKGLDRLVALKILSVRDEETTFSERFEREARALASINHPNIVAVYDSGESGGHYFLIMEYVEGANLRQMIRAKTPSPAEALEIVGQICTALQFAHDEGVVHRDIKPENILVNERGRVKIADFGLAKLLGRAPEAAITRATQAMGTPHYMAPEQIERPLEVDHRADIYSLGVVFYELLTGELPLGKFQVPSSKIRVDVRIDDVVLRTLEKEPEQRYQRAGDVKTDVENISGGGGAPIRAGSPGSAPTSGPAPRLALWPWFAGGGVLLFLALAVLMSALIFRGEDVSIRESTFVAVSFLGLLVLAFVATIVGIVRSLLNTRQGATGPWPWVLGILLLLLIPAGLGFFALVGSAFLLAGRRVESLPVMLSGTTEDHPDHTLFCDLVEEAKSLGLATERHARLREVVRRPELSEHEQMHFADAALVPADGESASASLAELLRYREPTQELENLVNLRARDFPEVGGLWIDALETEIVGGPPLAEGEHTPVCARIEDRSIYSSSPDSLRYLRTIARYPRLTDHERFHLIDRMFEEGFSADLADSAIALIESAPLSEAVRARLREEALKLSFTEDRERVLRALAGHRQEPR